MELGGVKNVFESAREFFFLMCIEFFQILYKQQHLPYLVAMSQVVDIHSHRSYIDIYIPINLILQYIQMLVVIYCSGVG